MFTVQQSRFRGLLYISHVDSDCVSRLAGQKLQVSLLSRTRLIVADLQLYVFQTINLRP